MNVWRATRKRWRLLSLTVLVLLLGFMMYNWWRTREELTVSPECGSKLLEVRGLIQAQRFSEASKRLSLARASCDGFESWTRYMETQQLLLTRSGKSAWKWGPIL